LSEKGGPLSGTTKQIKGNAVKQNIREKSQKIRQQNKRSICANLELFSISDREALFSYDDLTKPLFLRHRAKEKLQEGEKVGSQISPCSVCWCISMQQY
jgi:hypothetical protein